MQIAATLVKGKARIKFDAPKVTSVGQHSFDLLFLNDHLQGTYSLARAQQSFKSLVHIHEKNGNEDQILKFQCVYDFSLGWFTPPQSDG